MMTQYIQSAMRKAYYEILPDRSFYGEIQGFDGLFASAPVLDGCREQLQEVLEDWIVLGLKLNHKLPVVNGIKLGVDEEVAECPPWALLSGENS